MAAASIAAGAAAQPAPNPSSGIRLDLPFLDAPYNLNHGGRAPSWHQSLALSVDFYEASHTGFERAFSGRKWPSRLSILAFDLLASYIVPMPGTVGWLHEESHRAIMGRRGIDSFNDVYNFAPVRPALYVSHVTDDDLIRLKREHPEEHARMSAAGLEGEYRLVQRLESNAFFGKSRAWHLPIYLGVKIGSLGYVWSGHLDIDHEIDVLNDLDGADPAVRDFTGHDVLAWAYDLHRPDEPYAARGVHRSGVGIDRYIKPSDLTATELAYLKRQGLLQLVNFIDPFLFGSSGFRLTNPFNDRPMRITARGGHLLTPFGYTLDADVLLEQDRMRLFVVVHTYVSQQRTLPGIDVTWLEIPLGGALLVSPRAAVWWQPEGQRFAATQAKAGGLVGARIDLGREPRLGGYGEVEAKTAGWVAGNEYLGANVSVRLGLTLRIW